MRTRRNNKRRQTIFMHPNNSNTSNNDTTFEEKISKTEKNLCINNKCTTSNESVNSNEVTENNYVEIKGISCNLKECNNEIIKDSNEPLYNIMSNQHNFSSINTNYDKHHRVTLDTVWQGIISLQSSISNISNSLDVVSTQLNSFDPRINDLESDLNILKNKTANLETTQNDVDGLKNELQRIKKDLEIFKSKKEEKNVNMSNILIELREREIKSRNIFIYNVPEDNLWISQDYSTLEDINKFNSLVASRDSYQARKILTNIPNIGLDEMQTKRLGKINPDKCRPLRVTLQSKEDVIMIMKNKKLINKQYNIKTDLTKFQQQRIKELKEELDRNNVNKQNPTLTIKFINGEPQLLPLKRNVTKIE